MKNVSKKFKMKTNKHTCLSPGKVWAECLCKEVDPSDVPCIVCEGRDYLESRCLSCREAEIKLLRIRITELNDAFYGKGKSRSKL